MAKRPPYALVYAPQVRGHLRAIHRKFHRLIRDTIEEQLSFDPDAPTTNRKPLREPLAGATWELRLGPGNRFRVFYEVDPEVREVRVLAVGVKERGRLLIGGEEVGP
jgi:mRNA-degrading endonuclease RelE of RelBE toxin-antitoxin system